MFLKVSFVLGFYFMCIHCGNLDKQIGDKCEKDGVVGVCKSIEVCQSARADLKLRKQPKVCSYNADDPIVCCFDESSGPTAPKTQSGTNPNSNKKPDHSGECEPVPPTHTTSKTGQKAFDKCIEYQEKYVYPCEKSVGLTGGKIRNYHCYHTVDELIVGGSEAAEYEFPHMALITSRVKDKQWNYGGAIISEQFVLTAAHCIPETSEDGQFHYVFIGVLRQKDTSQRNLYNVKNIIIHPKYRAGFKYNDIALIQTKKTMAFSQFIVPACLHVAGERVDDNSVLATGWGYTKFNGSGSDILLKVKLNKYNPEKCNQNFENISNRDSINRGIDSQTQLCYGHSSESKDTCQGDSGGPIQIKNKKIQCMYTIVGVTSFGKNCGLIDEPAVYTKVDYYVPWIESIVWREE